MGAKIIGTEKMLSAENGQFIFRIEICIFQQKFLHSF